MATRLIIIIAITAVTTAAGCSSTQSSSMRQGEYMFYCHSGSEIYQSCGQIRCRESGFTIDAEKRFEPNNVP